MNLKKFITQSKNHRRFYFLFICVSSTPATPLSTSQDAAIMSENERKIASITINRKQLIYRKIVVEFSLPIQSNHITIKCNCLNNRINTPWEAFSLKFTAHFKLMKWAGEKKEQILLDKMKNELPLHLHHFIQLYKHSHTRETTAAVTKQKWWGKWKLNFASSPFLLLIFIHLLISSLFDGSG